MTALSLALLANAAWGLTCYETPGTLKWLCFNEKEVKANGPVRASGFYIGGPKNVERTSFMILVNCDKKLMTLQDSKGSNFAGGMDTTSEASGSLIRWMCEVKTPKADKSIRQF